MKRFLIVLFVLVSLSAFAQTSENAISGPDNIMDRMPIHTYERVINLKAGQEIDLMIEAKTVYAAAKVQSANTRAMAAMADPKAKPMEDPMPKESFTNGWCFIEGRALANGCETTMISWCSDSKVHVKALTDCVLTVRGN